MLITSHLLQTLVLSKALSINQPETYVALISGVAIDLDHFFVNRKWIQDIKDFIKERKITYGTTQHSWLQEIFFGGLSGIAIGLIISNLMPDIRWWIFPVFLLGHILLDSVMKYEHKPFTPISDFKYFGWLRSGTRTELIISCLGLLIFALL